MTEKRIRRNVVWLCVCDCGNCVEIRGGDLQSGRTRSCGCLRADSAKETHSIHGKAHSKIHFVWLSMKNRCFNNKAQGFRNYGGRGIRVCDEWKNDFQSFYDYVSQLPHFGEDGYSIDRINNDGNYEPGNVRWATQKEQVNNRRNSRKSTEDLVM